MTYRLRFWNDPNSPLFMLFASPHPSMPPETFETTQEAHEAATLFIKKFGDDPNSNTRGGYDTENDLYWIREGVTKDKFCFTRFEVTKD